MRRPGAGSITFVVVLAAAGWSTQGRAEPAGEPADRPPVATGGDPRPDGAQLYLTGCSSCHGSEGQGTGRGPSLRAAGAAGAYYYLSTGRMPLADDETQPRRKPPAYSRTEIAGLVDYVASLGSGPPLPRLDLAEGDLAEGGVTYRGSCAPCHAAAGIGGALSYGRAAPSVQSAEPLEVAAAIRIGPGQMPLFGPDVLGTDELASVVRYVELLRHPPTPGGAALGGAGPIPEGFVAWIFGVGALLVAVLWIGKRQERHGGG